MLPDAPLTALTGVQLFQFTVPGLPKNKLAVAQPEVMAVSELMPTITPIPFARSFVWGLSEWRGSVTTVVDLGSALTGHAPAPLGPNPRFLIIQVAAGTQLEVVAWPIMPGAGLLVAPARAPQADMPPGLLPAIAHTAITLDDQTLVLLDMQGLLLA